MNTVALIRNYMPCLVTAICKVQPPVGHVVPCQWVRALLCGSQKSLHMHLHIQSCIHMQRDIDIDVDIDIDIDTHTHFHTHIYTHAFAHMQRIPRSYVNVNK